MTLGWPAVHMDSRAAGYPALKENVPAGGSKAMAAWLAAVPPSAAISPRSAGPVAGDQVIGR
jgi:hypothetical protein